MISPAWHALLIQHLSDHGGGVVFALSIYLVFHLSPLTALKKQLLSDSSSCFGDGG